MDNNEDIKVYRITFLNTIKSSILILTLLSILVGYNIYAFNEYPYYNVKALLISIFVSLAMLGPIGFVHIEYLKQNWMAILEVDKERQRLRYRTKEKEVIANFDDITHIIKHQPKDTALMWEYEYYEIHFKSGDTLILTHFMVQDFSIPGIKPKIIERIIPSIYFSERVFENDD